jgi:hypothetical protein
MKIFKLIRTCYEYVSIKEVITKLLENNKIKEEIYASFTFKSKFSKRYYESHKLFNQKNTMKLILYYDELDIKNLLGDIAGVYKLGMFYYSIENLNRKLNSANKIFNSLQLCLSKIFNL